MKSLDPRGADALAAAVDAGRRAGLDVAGARVTRMRNSSHVELPRAGVLARVEPTHRADVAHRQVAAARAWDAVGAPTARLICPSIQPIVSPGGVVTLWQRLSPRGLVDLGDLGRTAGLLHSAGRRASLEGIQRFEMLADSRLWIDSPVDWLSADDRRALHARFEELSAWWEDHAAEDPLGTVLVHGDLHAENAVATDDGPVLVELEDAGVGPSSWDFVPLAVGVRRYGDPAEGFERFVAGYGYDPRPWPGFWRMCEIYELHVVMWSVHCSESSAAMAAEAAVRVAGCIGHTDERWTMR